MNPDRQQAIQYLCAPRDGLWHWTENGAVLAWHDGSTIAFREEIVQIIEWLAPNGLPSFGAIVFLLAACRGKVPALADIMKISDAPPPAAPRKEYSSPLTGLKQLQAQVVADLEQLQQVSRLPAELNSGVKAKCVLAEAVFELTKVERYVEAQAVLRGMRTPMNDAGLVDTEYTPGRGNYIRQIHIVSEGLKRHTAESLALRLRTGLDALPKEEDAELPAPERARRLIEELSRDREFGAVSRAARELMAAVRLPRRLAEREQLAIGGVADITNRGPLDRLLLSELAHDDLTLSVRVALNEALYLRREPPMREPPGALALLLDSGVRLWGVPRALAAAVALALIARDKQHSEILAWRAHGKQLQPVDLLSRNGLMQHLSALEPTAHAGDSMQAFADAASVNADTQSVLITHRDALADPEFRRALADNPTAPGFIATVDRDGRFELHAMPLAHRPPICEADIDLASVFDENVGVTPIRREVEPDLPFIFGISPFPFLLPVTGRMDFWSNGTDGFTYAVLNDRSLVRYLGPQSGARVIASNLPAGKTVWMNCDGDEVHLVKAGASQRPARLVSVTLPFGAVRVTDLASGPEVQAVYRYADVIVVIRLSDIRAYSLSDGQMLAHALNPHHWVNGRYFRGRSHFYFAVWDGERVKFEPVTMPVSYVVSNITTIFDREGFAGPWLLSRKGHVVSTESELTLTLPNFANSPAISDFETAKVSKDGHRLMVFGPAKLKDARPMMHIFDLVQKSWLDIRYAEIPINRNPPLPTWNLYRAIESIALFQNAVAICGRKVRWRKLALDDDGRLCIHDLAPTKGVTPQPIFGPPRMTRDGCTLRVAEIAGGSKMFLDSRGLLHFKSANLELPEISIVLAEGEVAGWTTDGVVCGPQFFFEKPIVSDPKGVFERIMNFFAKL
ncbi:MAG TPA: hypothetical protein VMF08_05935 [Candidatus Sulfotelmatobacter sp.]|nr:hypothetical protein [Candidatus Sulfotelmatobacter sp.]